MRVLVTYATKHGATGEIAEHIGDRLRAAGEAVDVRPVTAAGDLELYDAFVIGSAVYFGSWRKEAVQFIQRNRGLLSDRPVWLFSSGPLGTEKTDAEGNDVLAGAVPKQVAELRETIAPHDHRVFFGALDRRKFGLTERFIAALPAGRKLLVEGDFRDWDAIDAWTESIAHELALVPAPAD